MKIYCGIRITKSLKNIFLFIAIAVGFKLNAQQINHFKTTDGETLYYTTIGKGPKIILLYGGPGFGVGPMRYWADSLSNQFECVLFEQRGTGLSSKAKLDSTTINLKKATQDIEDLRVQLGEKQFKELLPQTNIFFIEQSGHFPDYEKPQELFKILRQVL